MNTIKQFVIPFVVVFLIFTAISVSAQTSLNVKEFGAVGDSKTDDTAAFQKALDTAATSDSQVVSVPRGNYRFEGSLNVPNGVTLKGVWESVPSHIGIRNKGQVKPTDDGTTFLVTGGQGQINAPPFLTLNSNSTLKGVCIYYPDQKEDDVPAEYPWTISMRGKNPAILDCELLNPYQAIDASQNERHLIRNISGQPLRLGVYVDSIYDIGRIENVHFNPWWSMKPKLFRWQMENGEAFVFGRSDWQYVHNTFCFGYNIGYHFIETKSGSCNGNFLGIGADDCYTAVVVDQSAPMGLLITNGEFVSFHGPEPTMIRVGNKNRGTIRFSNCAFWGPCRQIAIAEGLGTIGFSDCTFVQWGFKDKEGGKPNEKERIETSAIRILGGNLILRGCEFQDKMPQVFLGENIRKAIVTENLIRGEVRIENNAGEKQSIIIQNNASGN
ncbi:MAG: glycoside hydrolase family 55 protein [Planctomycetaceae bacterium]|nr:glycoside hydrolase family 55 protein [Planctomycetaceae bacterium]